MWIPVKPQFFFWIFANSHHFVIMSNLNFFRKICGDLKDGSLVLSRLQHNTILGLFWNFPLWIAIPCWVKEILANCRWKKGKCCDFITSWRIIPYIQHSFAFLYNIRKDYFSVIFLWAKFLQISNFCLWVSQLGRLFRFRIVMIPNRNCDGDTQNRILMWIIQDCLSNCLFWKG